MWLRLSTLFLAGLISACASSPPIDQVELMPAPDVYGDGLINPLPEFDPIEAIPYKGILFATDRLPAGPLDEEKYYVNDRGELLRVGVADVKFGDDTHLWDQAREFSMVKYRTEKYPVKIKDIEEWGFIGASKPWWVNLDLEFDSSPPPDATERFTNAIDAQLVRSKKKDVYIFVHGYKVVYENPVLVSAELWHFLGYEGAFIAYAWPSTPSKFAYIKDSDTSNGFARNFRILIETVANDTDVENIHVIAYSNGTRLVTRALEQLALKHYDENRESILKQTKLRNVILVGSDLDRGVFNAYVADRILDTTHHFTVYMSKYDKALGVSQFLTRRERLGQMFGADQSGLTESGKRAIQEIADQFSLVNVSDAEGADSGNGHGYFRSSPWASSDVLMTLYWGLLPNERGLVKEPDIPVFSFPPDYVQRMWAEIEKRNPEFAAKYAEFKQAQAEAKAN